MRHDTAVRPGRAGGGRGAGDRRPRPTPRCPAPHHRPARRAKPTSAAGRAWLAGGPAWLAAGSDRLAGFRQRITGRPARVLAGWRYRTAAWCDRLSRAWYARAATDRVLGGRRPGWEAVVQRWPWSPHRVVPRPAIGRATAAAPSTGRLVGMCGWTVALVLLGLPIAARAMAIFVIGSEPGWPPPALLLGLVGIGLPAAAFLTVRHRRLPWLLLAAATALLLISPRVG